MLGAVVNVVMSFCCADYSPSKAYRSTSLSLISCVLLIVMTVFGCQSSELDTGQIVRFRTVENAIMGGYQSAEDTAVVLITRWGGGGFGLCSGSLIAPNVVLTAQHCIADTVDVQTGESVEGVNCSRTGFQPPYPAFSMAITTRPYISRNYNDYYRVQEIVIPDDDQSSFCGRDIAILILEDSVPESEAMPLTPRVDEPLLSGESYSAIGYGHTGYANDSGVRRRRDDLTLTCVGGSDCLFLPYNQEWLGETGVCSGDSGGPAIDAKGRVTGIASRGPAVCASPVYGSVYSWGTFIKDTVARAASTQGVEPPAWVDGYPTDPAFSIAWGESCQNGLICESGLCLGGHCSRPCNDRAPCSDGYECIGVDLGAALYDGNYCSPIEIGGACSSDDECPGRCHDGLCTRYCDDILTCPTGFTCDAQQCTPAQLGGPCDETCAGGQCVDGVCSRSCGDGLPCPSGWNCDAGICSLVQTGSECADDAECVGGRCLDGLCTRYCDAMAPCSSGWVCDAAAAECVLGSVGDVCSDEVECGDGQCIGGRCTRQCGELAPCPAGYACTGDGLCSPVPAESGGCIMGTETSSRLPYTLLLGCVFWLLLMRRRESSC